MVTEHERDHALATLLTEHVHAARRARSTAPAERSTSSPAGRERQRIGIVTGAVLVAVVTLTVLALTLQRPTAPSPAAPSTPAVEPSPGQVLATFTSRDGDDQTRTVAANGAALEIAYNCTGTGGITTTIPRGPSFTGPTCTGPITASSRVPVAGTVPIHVVATGTATWTVTIRVAHPD